MQALTDERPSTLSETLLSAETIPTTTNPLEPIDAEPYFVDSAWMNEFPALYTYMFSGVDV